MNENKEQLAIAKELPNLKARSTDGLTDNGQIADLRLKN